MPTRVTPRLGTDLAYAILMPTLGASGVGTDVATQESCQVLTQVGQMLDPGAGIDMSKHL